MSEQSAKKETILLVEDESIVRDVVEKALAFHGYNVLAADNGHTAINLHSKYAGDIDLLLSDVLMPQLDGVKLLAKLKACRPSLKVLFMSGFAKDIVQKRGEVDPKVPFLQKPFSIERLAQKVREALEI